MLIKDKVKEITNDNYHYKNKKVEGLINGELLDYYQWEHSGKKEHLIQTNSEITKHGHTMKECLVISYTRSGKNEGSWRIALSFGRFDNSNS